MKCLPKVQQETRWSCALACIESILLSAGCDYPQRNMLEALADEFPEWKEHPGKIAPPNFPRVFEAAGMPVDMLLPNDIPETIELLLDSIGAIVSREKCWKDTAKTELGENWHAFQLLEVQDTRLIVMNPGFDAKDSKVEFISMCDLRAIGSRTYIFKSRKENT